MRALLLILALALGALPAFGQELGMEVPRVVLTGSTFDVPVTGAESGEGLLLHVGDRVYPVEADADGALAARGVASPGFGTYTARLMQGPTVVSQADGRAVPGWVSILPPLIAILIALLFKRVIPALFVGIWLGAWAAYAFGPLGLWMGLLETFQLYVLNALANPDRAAIILFSLMIGGMVGIISRNGGMQGVVSKIVGYASTPRRGQLVSGALGLVVFFDDYANTLVVGNTMRSVTDRLRISREKLAYIVDSTAAPIACLAFVTTWIGYEVGLIGDAVAMIDGYDESAYSIFLNSIPYSFYPLLAVFFVFAVAHSRRDFGPMYDAELRARTTGQVLAPGASVDEAAADAKELQPPEGKPQRAINALLPVLTLVVGVLAGLYVTGAAAAGEGASLREIIGEADSYRALLWASLVGMLVAGALSIFQGILTLEETVEAWYAGLKSMLFAMIILVLAWALSDITELLHTADFLTSALGDWLIPGLVPTLVFFLAAATAFATGSSWGTMGILMPLVLPLAWAVMAADGLHEQADYYHIIYSTVSAVLAGAVWGDHCSPISDTTILSSMASGCDHIDHVRTQLPYALTVGAVAVGLGTLPTGFGLPWWVSIIAGVVVLSLVLRFFGRRVADEVEALAAEPESTPA